MKLCGNFSRKTTILKESKNYSFPKLRPETSEHRRGLQHLNFSLVCVKKLAGRRTHERALTQRHVSAGKLIPAGLMLQLVKKVFFSARTLGRTLDNVSDERCYNMTLHYKHRRGFGCRLRRLTQPFPFAFLELSFP